MSIIVRFMAGAFVALAAVSPSAATAEPRTELLQARVRSVESRGTARDRAIAEAERLRGFYRDGARVERFGIEERRRAAYELRWLHATGLAYRHDPYVTGLLAQASGLMGDYYVTAYPAGAWWAYASASRWARWNWISDLQALQWQREAERYQRSWAALALAQGAWDWRPAEDIYEAVPTTAPGLRETSLQPVPTPKLDVATLPENQRAAWRDFRLEFATVAAKVHQARVVLEDRDHDLKRQGMSLNSRWASTALTMQGFLTDAADLAEARQFAQATEALRRAEAQRLQLRDATGQY
jgi:hypothetical protein